MYRDRDVSHLAALGVFVPELEVAPGPVLWVVSVFDEDFGDLLAREPTAARRLLVAVEPRRVGHTGFVGSGLGIDPPLPKLVIGGWSPRLALV